MKVSVVAILETAFSREPALAKIMDNRLLRAAKELQDYHLIGLLSKRSNLHSLTIQLSYNQKYKIRYQIMSDVPPDVDMLVKERCGRLGYILYKSIATEQEKALW
ncbi:hypothetical protein ASE74_15805 [Pedobacter sp. Leaf216]|uniref:hypothetical protein n=1 Tax=Pedobacter sp. Leaf216 TaxID=1735684 RepID=UPI0006F88AEF|nr:hypothetical protein [Pedobacter sp. Leaf216]KQM77863.1 hypothetical protein ASE74_15805 [Pedobacter sp. Leaf216]